MPLRRCYRSPEWSILSASAWEILVPFCCRPWLSLCHRFAIFVRSHQFASAETSLRYSSDWMQRHGSQMENRPLPLQASDAPFTAARPRARGYTLVPRTRCVVPNKAAGASFWLKLRSKTCSTFGSSLRIENAWYAIIKVQDSRFDIQDCISDSLAQDSGFSYVL